VPWTPLFPFGHGLSYTTFGYANLRLSRPSLRGRDSLVVTVDVTNAGARAGTEVAQLYLRDPVAQVTRPVRQLAGFARVGLAPGEGADVRFLVHADRTAYPNRSLEWIVEPGDVEVLVGTSAADLPCRGRVRLTGALRVVGHDRQLVTPVALGPVAGDAAT
jgi:beta-glucosidase